MAQGLKSDQTSNRIATWIHNIKSNSREWLENYIFTDQKELIGLVINADFVKIMKIDHFQGRYHIDYFDVQPLPPSESDLSPLHQSDAIVSILQTSLAKSHTKTKNVAIAVPRMAAMTKTILVDSRFQDEEIESRVKMEVARLFPGLVGEIYIDFVAMGQATTDATKKEVMIVACRKNQIEPYINILNKVGLSLKVVDVNYYAMERVIPFLIQQYPIVKATAILNISFSSIELLVVKDNQVIYTNETNYNGTPLKKLIDVNKDQFVREITKEEINTNLQQHLARHVSNIMQYFYTSLPHVRVERIFLADDCAALMPGIDEFISKEVNKETVLANPFKDMDVSSRLSKPTLIKFAPALFFTSGVALSKLS